MNKLQETENSYLAELKSLFQDKFFMLLLGISVAIVLLSTVYSAIKPKNQSIASGQQTQINNVSDETSNLTTDKSDGLTGLEEENENKQNPNEALTVTRAQEVLSPTLMPTKADTVKAMPTVVAQSEKKTQIIKPSRSEYVVKAGDSLWTIAEANYGSGYNFSDIAAANKLTDANAIEVGQKLSLPGANKKMATIGDITPEAASISRIDQSAKSHKVVEGDCLWNISMRYFGNGYEWPRLAASNNIPNPDLIYPGQTIILRN